MYIATRHNGTATAIQTLGENSCTGSGEWICCSVILLYGVFVLGGRSPTTCPSEKWSLSYIAQPEKKKIIVA